MPIAPLAGVHCLLCQGTGADVAQLLGPAVGVGHDIPARLTESFVAHGGPLRPDPGEKGQRAVLAKREPDRARAFAGCVLWEAGVEPRDQVSTVFRRAFCRPPTAVEQAAMATFLDQTRTRIIEESAGTDVAGREALRQMCRVIFNLNEFAYSD